MDVKIECIKRVSEIISKKIEFPYYGWWSHKKETIIKMYPVYDKHDTSHINSIKIIKISCGFGFDTFITTENITVSNGVIDEEITYFLRDYADIATETQFNDFKNIALNDINI